MRKIIFVAATVCAMSELLLAQGAPLAKIGERSREEIVDFFTDNEFGRRPKEWRGGLLVLYCVFPPKGNSTRG
jgi:hypothetical protein